MSMTFQIFLIKGGLDHVNIFRLHIIQIPGWTTRPQFAKKLSETTIWKYDP